MLAVRLPTALASAGTVFVVFWLAYLLFGRDEESGRATPWRGLLVGGVGAGLLAVSIGQTVLGRTAFRANLLPLLLSLCLALLWRGWQERSWPRVVMAGACAGLVAYTYTPARVTPFLFLFFGLSFVLPFRSATREAGQMARHCWARLRAELPWAGIFVGVAGLVAAPLLVYAALQPEHFFSRSSQVWLLDPSRSQGDPLGAFLGNVWGHLLAFGFRGDPSWWNNVPGQPMLNPWEAFFFWLGVGMAVWRWQRRPAYRLLLLWLGVLILPAMLDIAPPNTLRMIGAVPAIYLLIGVGVWEAFRFLQERYFQKDAPKAAIAMAAVVSGLILVQAANTYHTYFQKRGTAPNTGWTNESEWSELAWALNAQPSDSEMVYLIPGNGIHHSFKYLYLGKASVHAMPD